MLVMELSELNPDPCTFNVNNYTSVRRCRIKDLPEMNQIKNIIMKARIQTLGS